jgi:hypothetical protein
MSVLLGKIATYIINPIITLGFVVATIIFFIGIIKYISNADDAGKRKAGQDAITYGIVGLFVMFSVYGILNFVLKSFGIVVKLPWQ